MSPRSHVTAHDHVEPLLRALIKNVEATAKRVVSSASPLSQGPDAEAVHDFRVALRKLRTVLRPLRPLYGDQALRKLGRELGEVADASGLLRDEEVLEELMRGLPLDDASRAAVDTWLRGRRPRRRALLRELSAHLRQRGALRGALQRLRRLLLDHEQNPPQIPLLIEDLAWDAVHLAMVDMASHLVAPIEDGLAMHNLRIRCKRLRYCADLFAGVLQERGAELQRMAAKLQRKLGDLHDIDVAIERVLGARTLPPETRDVLIVVLRAERETQATRVREAIVALGPGWLAAPSSVTPP